MKKSKVIIILSICVVLLGIYSIITTVAMVERTREYDELADKYNDAVDDYKSLSQEHSEDVLEEVFATPVVIESIASSIDDNAAVNVVDDVVYMYVPYSKDVKDKVEEYAWGIPSSLKNYDYKSCIITVVDDEGKCTHGWTILTNGETYAFLSE